MSLISDGLSIVSAFKGASDAKKQNKVTAQQLADAKAQAAKSNAVGDYMQMLAKSLNSKSSTGVDSFGNGVRINPVTGEYETLIGQQPTGIQDASYGEELNRNTVDQTRRREGLVDAERMRRQAGTESDTALRDLSNFRAGVGAVDPTTLAGTMLANRTKVVNSGYDDAARAANTLSVRTGQNAGAALSEIARNRNKDVASQLGDPETEALTLANQINSNKQSQLSGAYGDFNTRANNVYDAEFSPSTYAKEANDNNQRTQALDINRADTVGSLGTGAGSLYGNAGLQIQNATNQRNANYKNNISGQLLQGLGNGYDAIAQDLVKAFSGLGG